MPSMADRTVIEWDKDDIDSLGILKVDVLALGMLTCISKALALVNANAHRRDGHRGCTSWHFTRFPPKTRRFTT